ncbi:MAG: hypothetical protein WKF73_08045 [Nocardioidaceae bacterium]
MRCNSSDSVTAPDAISQSQLPNPAICWACASWSWLRRRASAARLLSVMSRETPKTPTTAPRSSTQRPLRRHIVARLALVDVQRFLVGMRPTSRHDLAVLILDVASSRGVYQLDDLSCRSTPPRSFPTTRAAREFIIK